MAIRGTFQTSDYDTDHSIQAELTYDQAKDHIDLETVRAVINARYRLMSQFGRATC